ncbi:YfbM family protein [Nocardioides marinquilinus]|uniref:YfbM family protein n=1 Tax=Nocardioides marinquilinus TaxID=1210400 RepID=A0ABP9PPK4_9ACTN
MGMTFVAAMIEDAELDAVRSSPDLLHDLRDAASEDDGRSVDLDKAWHGIHFLLTGSGDLAPAEAAPRRRLFGRRRDVAPAPAAGAESLAVLGGEPVGADDDWRVLTAAQVAEVAAALEPLDRAALAHRVDLDAMAAADLYPQIWEEPDVFEEYLGPAYDDLRDFYRRAAAAGCAVVLSIS